MNHHTTATCFLAFLLAQVVSAELEAVWGGKFLDGDYSNKALGLSLKIQERPVAQRTGGVWGSGRTDISVKEGVRVAIWTRESDERTISCEVPLDEAVIRKLIREAVEPPEFRFMAVTNLHLLAAPETTKAKMLEEATRIGDAWVRGHAWSRVFWFPERDLVAHLFPHAIKDPCLDIAHDALPVICEHYKLRNADGSEVGITRAWRGLVSARYRVNQQEREVVAGLLRAHDQTLISLEDIETIQGARIPPDEWFRHNLRREPPEDVSYYLEPYKNSLEHRIRNKSPIGIGRH